MDNVTVNAVGKIAIPTGKTIKTAAGVTAVEAESRRRNTGGSRVSVIVSRAERTAITATTAI